MKKLLGIFAVGMFAMSVNACGIAEVVDDINDAVKDAAFQIKVEDAFGTAISTVTLQVISESLVKASEAMTASTAPGFKPADAIPVNVTIPESTSEVEGGGTVTVSGTLTGNIDSTTGIGDLTLDINSKWANLPSTLDDGTVVKTSGESKVTGTMAITADYNAKGTFTNVGKLTLDGKNVDFNVTVTFDTAAGTITISGKINGSDMLPRLITVPVYEDENDVEYVCLVQNDNDNYCKSFGSNGFSKDYAAAFCGNSMTNVVEGSCEEVTDVVGWCEQGENVTYYYVGDTSNQQTVCEQANGDWTSVVK